MTKQEIDVSYGMFLLQQAKSVSKKEFNLIHLGTKYLLEETFDKKVYDVLLQFCIDYLLKEKRFIVQEASLSCAEIAQNANTTFEAYDITLDENEIEELVSIISTEFQYLIKTDTEIKDFVKKSLGWNPKIANVSSIIILVISLSLSYFIGSWLYKIFFK